MVYLTLACHEEDPRRNVQVSFALPQGMKSGHVFRILIHIDTVEDLLFYHYPREELLADGRVQWRDFHWQLGRADGELDEDDLHPPTAHCRWDRDLSLRRREDDDEDREPKRPRNRGFLSRVRLH